MICRYCSTELNESNITCPGCGSITGVKARTTLRLSLYLGVGGWLLVFISILNIFLSGKLGFRIPLSMLGTSSIFLGMVCALISIPLAISGFKMKKYILVRKR